MAESIDQIAEWATPLLARLAPVARKAAMAEVAEYLRRSQTQRIASQRNPDGSPYEARRPRASLAASKGGIRRGMFLGLRKARNLQRKATSDSAMVAMQPRALRVARVHQFGLTDKVDRRDPGSPSVRYARRELLGFMAADLEAVADILIRHAIPA
ncbi:phage virion morphogenesis protein [Comamonas antarctica]|uniref:Phage virion morphogenesis protein n=1 Tax=Comamonas antarctica TaxID=2743470 RepID=A0A6N1X085_9BURK|nr:phage virion morphogenesis protein [Comamonas antarctica]QKV52388.1 phage virion morphogenesis protein [Comamonas antarctica]